MTFDTTFHSRFVYTLWATKTRGNSVTEFFLSFYFHRATWT